MFVNDANVDGNGTMVASGTTTYTTTSQFNSSSTVTIHVRATSMQYWSTTSTDAITILGKLLLVLMINGRHVVALVMRKMRLWYTCIR